MSDRVTPAMLEFYERAKSYAKNAIEAGVDWEDFNEAMKIAVIDAAMERANNNKSHAAEILKMHRNQLSKYTSNKIAHKMRRTTSETYKP
jgi:DNA-binding NtrC family response regulator